MKTLKKLGIWMDHSKANIMEFTSDVKETKTLSSNFSSDYREKTLQRSESEMHNKDQQKQETFYKNLSIIIKDYDEVLLFGPTEAKNELYNLLKENYQFNKIKIEVKNSDKMNYEEQHSFVDEYFKRFDFEIYFLIF